MNPITEQQEITAVQLPSAKDRAELAPGLQSLYQSIEKIGRPVYQRKENPEDPALMNKLVELVEKGDWKALFAWEQERHKYNESRGIKSEYEDLRADLLTAVLSKKISVETFSLLYTIEHVKSAPDRGVIGKKMELSKVSDISCPTTSPPKLQKFLNDIKSEENLNSNTPLPAQYCVKFSGAPNVNDLLKNGGSEAETNEKRLRWNCLNKVKKELSFKYGYYFFGEELYFFHPTLVAQYFKNKYKNESEEMGINITPWFGSADFYDQHWVQKILSGRLLDFSPPGERSMEPVHNIQRTFNDIRTLHDWFHIMHCFSIMPSCRNDILNMVNLLIEHYQGKEKKVDKLMLELEDMLFESPISDTNELLKYFCDKIDFNKIKFLVLFSKLTGKIECKSYDHNIQLPHFTSQLFSAASKKLEETNGNILLASVYVAIEAYCKDLSIIQQIKEVILKTPDILIFEEFEDASGTTRNCFNIAGVRCDFKYKTPTHEREHPANIALFKTISEKLPQLKPTSPKFDHSSCSIS